MWVCRAGKNGVFYDKFIKDKHIYLSWDGYRMNLSKNNTIDEFRNVVIKEKKPESRTTVSNWAGQLKFFCVDMKVGDYVLVPSFGSRSFMLCKITGEYDYKRKDPLPHSRSIEIITTDVPRDIFPQAIQYSLGAYRTIFKVKQEDLVMEIIAKNQKL